MNGDFIFRRMLYLQDDGNTFRKWRRSWHQYDYSTSAQHPWHTCSTYAIASISLAYKFRYPPTGPVLHNISFVNAKQTLQLPRLMQIVHTAPGARADQEFQCAIKRKFCIVLCICINYFWPAIKTLLAIFRRPGLITARGSSAYNCL